MDRKETQTGFLKKFNPITRQINKKWFITINSGFLPLQIIPPKTIRKWSKLNTFKPRTSGFFSQQKKNFKTQIKLTIYNKKLLNY